MEWMNHKLFIAFEFLVIVGLSLFFVSLYVRIPRAIGIIFNTLILFFCIVLLISRYPDSLSKKLDVWAGILIALFSIYLSAFSPYWNSEILSVIYNKKAPTTLDLNCKLNKKEAVDDLNYMFKAVKRIHPMMHDSDYKPFVSSYDALIGRIEECDSISVLNLWQDCQQILSTFHDGHTKTFPQYDQWRRCGIDSLGIIVSVNGETISDLYERKKSLYSTETPQWAKDGIISHLHTYEGLSFLGFDIAAGVDFGLKDKNGEIVHRKVFEKDFEYPEGQNSSSQEKIGYWIINDTSDFCYVKLYNCNYYGYKKRRHFDKSISMMIDSVQNNNIHNLIIDVRNNLGGNPALCLSLVKHLPIDTYRMGRICFRRGPFTIEQLNIINNRKHSCQRFSGRVYCLTSHSTFSAAMNIADCLQGNHLATIVGESPGNTPNSCGNITKFILPNSQLSLTIPTARYFRVDETIDYDMLIPDIEIPSETAFQYVVDSICTQRKVL